MPNSPVTLQSFGLALQQARKQAGFSQTRLAEKAGINRSYLASVEAGRRNLGLENITALCAALDMNTSTLLRRAERLAGEPAVRSTRDD